MKVIVDTNVLMSGIFFSGPPSDILKAWKEKKIQLLVSKDILEEYQRIGKKLETKYPKIEFTPFFSLLTKNTTISKTRKFKKQICEDKDDDIFLECAISSKAKIIVTGDKLLLNCSGYKGVHITTPREFKSEFL